MDYKKKYEEALERAREWYNKTEPDSYTCIVESIFPELKESKEEWIEKLRKEIITFLGNKKVSSINESDAINVWLAWLEKQCKTIKIKKGKNYLCTKTHKYAGLEWIEGVKYYSHADYSLVNQGWTCYCPKCSKEEHNNFFKEVEYEGCVEKQGEQKPYGQREECLVCQFNYAGECNGSCAMKKEEPQVYETKNGEVITYSETDGYKVVEPKFKVGDTIINIHYRWDGNSRIREITDGKYIFDSGSYIDIEEQDSWELVDKNKPKFKVEEGKWYICTQTFVLRGKIIVIKGQAYQAQEKGAIKGEEGCLFVDKHDGKASEYFRLWTIKHAREGDILYSPCCKLLWIYKDEKTCHVGSNLNYNSGSIVINKPICIPTDVQPATKEQRNLLFQKMKDAGYEWDDKEKKPIKSEAICMYSTDNYTGKERETLCEGCEASCKYNPTDWSEDDSFKTETLTSIIKSGGSIKPELRDEWVNWLKSFKNRVLPQSKEWSEEDEYLLGETIQHLEELIRIEKVKHCGIDVQYYQRDIDWLKSIKTRYTWNPSKEHYDGF